jgi:hypothetical protein
VRRRVSRVLLVLRGPITPEAIRERWAQLSGEVAELAVCYELPQGHDGFVDGLLAQRGITQALRQVCGPSAENIAIFVVTDHDGDRVDDYARVWGATVVHS